MRRSRTLGILLATAMAFPLQAAGAALAEAGEAEVQDWDDSVDSVESVESADSEDSSGLEESEEDREEPVDPLVAGPWGFEDDLEGWTVESSGVGVTVWGSQWEHQPEGGHESTGWVGIPDYGDAFESILTSPVITTTDPVVVLEHRIRHFIEGNEFDHLVLEVGPADGSTWEAVRRYGGRTASYPGWDFEAAVLQPPTESFRIRYRFYADELGSGRTTSNYTPDDDFQGAFDDVGIDDVQLVLHASSVAPEPLLDGPAAPRAVLAVIDSGINPYHEQFRDDSIRAFQHPSTYLPGYPPPCLDASVPDHPCSKALWLSLDAPTYDEAVERDGLRWAEVEAQQLYWFPGTRIVGAYATVGLAGCAPRCVLDGDGHGTSMASRAAAVEFGACPGCLIASVQGFNAEAVDWASGQSWIDAQSNSWLAKALGLLGDVVGFGDVHEAATRAAQQHLAVFSSGNGSGFNAGVHGVAPSTTYLDPAGSAPGVVNVGGHDSGYVNHWHDVPVQVVSDICRTMRAAHDSIGHKDFVGGGTSTAAPYAAGHAVQLLLDARTILGDVDRAGMADGIAAQGDAGAITSGPLADGVFTLDEWKQLVLTTATERPEAQPDTDGPRCSHLSEDPESVYFGLSSSPVKWTDVPDEFPEYVSIGYGATDRVALEAARAVLRGDVPLPDRSDTDQYMALDQAAREAIRASAIWP